MTGSQQLAVATAQRFARGTVVGAVVIGAVWHVANDIPAVVFSWQLYRWPVAVLAAWFVYTTAGVVMAVELLRGRATVRYPWLWVGIALFLSGLVAVACQGDVVTFQNWAWGSIGWLAVLVCWNRPMVSIIGFLLANAALNGGIMLVLGSPDRIAAARYLMIVYGSIALQLGFAVGARALAATADKAARAAASRNETITERLMAEEADRARQHRYRELQRSTASVIANLAAGASDPADEAVRRSCAVEAARLRRLMLETDDLPNPLLHELRACADIAERRGVIVDFAVAGDLPSLAVELRRQLTETAIEVLSATSAAARLTVVGAPDQVNVSIVADAVVDESLLSSAQDVVTTCHREGDRLWTDTLWMRPSPSPSSKITPLSSRESDIGSRMTHSVG
jgi:hypothetical protein